MNAVTSEAPATILQGEEVGKALLGYLAERHGLNNARFQEQPEQIIHGWETYIYSFQLAGDELVPEWARPLILRIYAGTKPDDRAGREGGIQRFVANQGYPAPVPLAVEPSEVYLGRPFMIMERAPGVPMLELIAGNPVAAYRFARKMAELQIELHQLPLDGCPLPSDGTLVDRRFKETQTLLSQAGTTVPEDAQPALEWLTQHKNVVAEEQEVVCHHDVHPLNILVAEDGALTLLDWSGAAVGDRHSDIANTLLLLRTAPIEEERLVQRLFARFGRGLFAWLYLRRYRQLLPVDEQRLHYWEALRAFEWWIFSHILLNADPESIGVKPDTPERLPAGHLERLQDYFWQRAGNGRPE